MLAQVLWNGISLVVIDLGEHDEAQVIFETLNARGTPLLAFDLVKNLVFRRAEAEGLALDVLHDELWSQLEDRYWRQLIGRGHPGPRSEQFLLHWLTMRAGDEVPTTGLFGRFADEFQAGDGDGVRSASTVSATTRCSGSPSMSSHPAPTNDSSSSDSARWAC